MPVVFAVHDGFVGVPIDRVKLKASSKLQRQTNLEADPRASLLIEHWNHDDWSKLWWVRAELRYEGPGAPDRSVELANKLAEAFVQYRGQPFSDMLVLNIAAISGWTAS